jgi:hypothetical protein
MYQKAIGTMYNQADKTVDTYNKSKRSNTRSCLTNHKKLCGELLAIAEGTADIEALFKKYPHTHLQAQIEEVEDLLTSKYIVFFQTIFKPGIPSPNLNISF